MPTLAELCKEYGINPDVEEQEKVASVNEDNSEVSQLNSELNEGNFENKNEGDDMSLTDLYNDAFGEDVDLEKVAEAEAEDFENEDFEKFAMEKVAEEWRTAGRFMAHGFYDELEKIGAAVEQMSDSEVLPTQFHAEGANKTQINDDGKLAVNTPEARKANADALREKKIQKIMGKKESVNVDGQVGEDHMVAPDAAK